MIDATPTDTIGLEDAELPDGLRIYAIGDVHGCNDQLIAMLEAIYSDLESNPIDRYRLIFLGDFVDRGPANKHVIDTLITLQATDENVEFLLGNHDERIITFLDEPTSVWDDMMNWGGVDTLSDYGVMPGAGESSQSVSERFKHAIPESHVEFFRSLKPSSTYGDYFFCHAGVRPGVPLSKQALHDLTWIRDDFLEHPGLYEKIIVHGHTPVMEPEMYPNRINVDTKCYETGILTAVVLEGRTQVLFQAVNE